MNFKLLYILFCSIGLIHSQAQSRSSVTNIHIETYGKGAPLLVINGGPGMNSKGFRPLAKSLAEDYHVIIYDQRGTGKSTLNEVNIKTITLDLMVEDIEIIRDSLKIKEWHILGHSFGGMLASYYTSRFPEKIKSLILSSSGGLDMELFNLLDITSKLSKKQRDSLNYYSQKIQEGDTSYQTRFNRGKFLAPAYLYNKKYIDIVAHRLTQGNSRVNRLVFQNMRKMNFDLSNALKKFDKPVLIIQGKQDIIPLSISEKAYSVFSNSKLVVLDKCGHYGWLDQPKDYFASIRNFIKKQ